MRCRSREAVVDGLPVLAMVRFDSLKTEVKSEEYSQTVSHIYGIFIERRQKLSPRLLGIACVVLTLVPAHILNCVSL